MREQLNRENRVEGMQRHDMECRALVDGIQDCMLPY